MQDKLDAYVAYFNGLKPRDLVLLGKYYDREARFKDPFNDVLGVQAIRSIFDDMFAKLDNPRFKIAHAALCDDAHTALLRWDLLFSYKGKKRVISGTSEIMFNQKGLVLSHIDYWDPAENIYYDIPVLGYFLKMIKEKLASP